MSIESSNYVNQTALLLSVSSGVGAVASSLKAASAETALKTGAFVALTLGCATGAASAVTAWFDPSSKDVKSYLSNVKSHFGYGLSATVTFVAQEMSAAMIKGVSDAVRDGMYIKVRSFFAEPKKDVEEESQKRS